MQVRRCPLPIVVLAFAWMAATHAAPPAPEALNPSPHAIDIPGWFQETFLDFRDDIRGAARAGKRLMVYFGQDGCPYCRELMRVNFSHKGIVDKTRRHFTAIALNIWGDREVTWIDGKVRSEKAFAAFLKVQFTPTILLLDEMGNVALRLNGYYPPHKFDVALDYVAGRHGGKTSFADYLRWNIREADSGTLHDELFFLKPPFDFGRSGRPGARPLAVLFEQKHCAACDELHAVGFKDKATLALVPKFDVARLELFGKQVVTTPAGKRLTEAQWGRELKVAYTPTIVFFDARGEEVLRIEAYLRPFHLASSFDYVASGAYRTQPSFQRFIQARAERIRERGGNIELW
ncbi:MAG: thioredoxin fold domain-containing protein [Betaproteobacteria bacterium]|nr:thioredoxin fold domain-containing protein [Betaproteobacteria bacterium]